jgi:hypothetical protein
MVAPRTDVTNSAEELLARLTATAYSVALRHGVKAPFIDVELALWRALREVLSAEPFPPVALPPVWGEAQEQGAAA